MNRRLLTLGHLLTAGTAGVGALFVAACTGKLVPASDGTPPELVPVAVGEISVPVVPCGEGSRHPNVCCELGSGQGASCGAYSGAPFQACGPTAMTYPDPRFCCPLDGSTDCVSPPPTPVPAPPSPPTCGYTCPPGQYQPEGSAVGTCCFNDGTLIACTGVGWAGGAGGSAVGTSGEADAGFTPTFDSGVVFGDAGSTGVATDAGVSTGWGFDGGSVDTGAPVVSVDAGCYETSCVCEACADGGPCPLCDCPAMPACPPRAPTPPPPAPVPVTCGVCPLGWQVPAGQPFLCCAEAPSGVIACFSQGVPPVPEPLPAPVPIVSPGPIAADAGSTLVRNP